MESRVDDAKPSSIEKLIDQGGYGGLGISSTAGDASNGKAVPKRGLTKAAIRRVMKVAVPEIRKCYLDELYANPKLEGSSKVKILIAKTGKVTDVTMTKLFHKNVDACLIKIVKDLEFPPPSGAGVVIIHYPFNFFR